MRKIHSLVELIYNPITDKYDTLRDEWEWYKGSIALAGGVPVMEHTDWAFYEDGTESGSAIIGSKNINQTLEVDTIYLFRAGVHETAGTRKTNLNCQIQYNHNGGGFNAVGASSSVVQTVATANIADGDDTTQRMTSFTYISNNNCFDEVDGVAGGTLDPNNNGAEMLWAIQILSADVADNDSIELKVVLSGGADLDAYNQTNPTITVNEPVGGISIPVVMNQLRNQGIS